VRLLPTSLTLLGFTVAAALSGCGSDADSTPGGTAGASGSGTVGSAGAASPTAGGPQAGGPSGTGGSAATAGSGTVGSAGSTGTGTAGSSNVGAGGAGGASGTAGSGSVGTAGSTSGTAGGGADVDQMGKANAGPGATTSAVQDYLRLGEVRILNNNWGSAELGCNAPMSVFVNQDKSFGWSFDRGNCDTADSNQKPDFPQIEFGIHPFGKGNSLVTSPEFSSTTLLPLQVKDVSSASVTIDSLNITLEKETSWNITFEFWLSERNPITDPNPGVYAELMTFWGWNSGKWPEGTPSGISVKSGSSVDITAGSKAYKLTVQDDQWAGGKWRYFQFRSKDGSQKSFSGKVDVKPLLDYLVNQRSYSKDYWVTRFEIGSEIDDNTKGKVTMKNVSFEVNGQTRSAVIGTAK